jgi:glycosyltransferase involved in cell wall biosynthesis
MNILMITVRADPGGGPEHVYQLSKALIDVATGEVNLYIASPKDHPYWGKYRDLVGLQNLVFIPHRKFDISTLLSLSKFVVKNKINIIHSHGKGAGIYGRILALITRTPCVHSFHGIHIGEYNYFQEKIYLTLEKFLSVLTSQVIATSKSEFDIFLNLKICKKNKISTIYNGVQIEDKAIIRSESLNAVCNQVFSMVRYTYQKNVEMQIEIAKCLKDNNPDFRFDFLILGTGETKDDFVESLKQKDLCSHFKLKDFVENRYELMLNSLCYLSTSRWEGLPLSLIEAMACGLPIVATSVSGNVDLVIHNETGFLFDQEAPEQAADYIRQLIEDRQLHARMSAKSREIAISKFSSAQMAKTMHSLYAELSIHA